MKNDQCSLTKNALLADWERFYKEYFDRKLELSDSDVPPKLEGFDCPIITLEGISTMDIYRACTSKFPFRRPVLSLDEYVGNDRNLETTRIIWSDGIWPSRNRGISFSESKRRRITGITLPEFLIKCLKFWDETKTHFFFPGMRVVLAGSRWYNNKIPTADCHIGNFEIGGVFPNDSFSHYCLPAVVSL